MRRVKLISLSATSGILLSLPWLISSLSWVLFFAFVPLLMAEYQLIKQKHQRISSFFLPAFIAFLIWNLLSCWWIGHVSLVGMLLIAAINALLMTTFWYLRHLVRRQFGDMSAYFSLIVFWLTFEFLQHNWTIQWPWLTLGNGFANSVKIIQWYEFTGVLGGSLWVLISNILIFFAAKSLSDKLFLKSIKPVVFTLIVVFLPLFWSLFLYSNYSEKGAVQKVVVLQPNIDPYTEKFSGISSEFQVSNLLSLADSNISDSTDFIIAPETALPSMWEDSIIQNQSLQRISKIIRKYPRISFIGGAITQRKFISGELISGTARQSADSSFYYDVFNSALMIDSISGVQLSHKSILVSGVEKMPFQKYFSFLGKYVLHLGGTSGSLATANEIVLFSGKDGVKIGPVICFESAFGEYVGRLVKNGANLIFVITNDGWWKDSPGCWQHFGYSRLRAVETRRSIARCANTGISGFINQRGDVLKKTGLNLCEALYSPIRMNDKITFYVSWGDYLGRISVFLSMLIVIYLLICRWRGSDIFHSILGKKNPH